MSPDTPQPQDEELVERVAEAIWDAGRHPGSTKWGDLRFELQEISRHEARAALAVARPLVAKAQRQLIVEALEDETVRLSERGNPDAIRTGILAGLGHALGVIDALPLISEVPS